MSYEPWKDIELDLSNHEVKVGICVYISTDSRLVVKELLLGNLGNQIQQTLNEGYTIPQ